MESCGADLVGKRRPSDRAKEAHRSLGGILDDNEQEPVSKRRPAGESHRQLEVHLNSPFHAQLQPRNATDANSTVSMGQPLDDRTLATSSHVQPLPTDFSNSRGSFVGPAIPTPSTTRDHRHVFTVEPADSHLIQHLQCPRCHHSMRGRFIRRACPAYPGCPGCP